MESFHSTEILAARLKVFYNKFGTNLDYESANQSVDLFTKERWTIGDKNMVKLLDTLVYLELEVSSGERRASCGKNMVIEKFNYKFYTDHFLKRINPVHRGTRGGKVNDYAASTYMQHGFNAITNLEDSHHQAKCLRRYGCLVGSMQFPDLFTSANQEITSDKYSSLEHAFKNVTKLSFSSK